MKTSSALRAAIERQAWSQAQAAKAAGVTPSTICRLLADESSPNIRTIVRLKRGIPGFEELLSQPEPVHAVA